MGVGVGVLVVAVVGGRLIPSSYYFLSCKDLLLVVVPARVSRVRFGSSVMIWRCNHAAAVVVLSLHSAGVCHPGLPAH